ncbi:SPRY domain-containing protein 4 isoform X2 [Phyllopteryx taeniolatus]|uniref:SPRY domain-containing protein 4 isoform X2 n=1 Tax=Phyllopteryx taeniolatus TaxID=161469 RepID=UPI002AD23D35|nr:SPRY domain-containing protein 4 isoform X2 [Phyllopteryx taeniolatus]
MASPRSAACVCRLAGRTVGFLAAASHGRGVLWPARRQISTSTGDSVQFRLDERTAHSSLDLFKKDTGVIYRMLGLDPSHVQANPERFRDWAVVFGDEKITGGRHYWEVTVKKSQEFRVGVAEALMSRDDCVGTSDSSWVFGYAQRKWFAMTNNKMVPVTLVGKADRVGILLDFEAGLLGLVDIEKRRIVHAIRRHFKTPLCPAFGLWDGELLTHSGLEEPEGLKEQL